MKNSDKIIIIGIGNSGRQDDGLGWAFVDEIKQKFPGIMIDYKYQLQIEDADLISSYDTVFFIDATKENTEKGFSYAKCQASEQYSFSTHALQPETILHLCKTIYNKHPNAYILGIQGYEWDLQIGLTKKAKQNLDYVTKVFEDKLLNDYIYLNY